MKKVTIFSTFYSVDWAYSLTTVVHEQIKMFVRNGYKIDVIVNDTFKPEGYFADPNVTLRYIPDVSRSNEGDLPDDYEAQSKRTEEALEEVLKETDVCITHDVIYQPAHIIFNIAARAVAAKRGSGLRWLHWIHSATSPSIRCSKEQARSIIQSKFPHSFICYPNAGDIRRVAKNFGYEEDEVKVVHHATDIPDYLGFGELSERIYRQHDYDSADIIAIYPIRLDRGKQVQHVIKALGAIKRLGRTVRGLIMDFHSTGGDKVIYRQELKAIAKEWDVEKEVLFASELDPSTNYAAPRSMVRDFMLVSNLYLHPSTSETYSLTTQEAAICKNLIMLNQDFPPMKSVWGDDPVYRQFSSALNVLTGQDGETITKYDNENAWYRDLALNIIYYIEHNKVLQLNKLVRQKRNIDYIFLHQLEPILAYEE